MDEMVEEVESADVAPFGVLNAVGRFLFAVYETREQSAKAMRALQDKLLPNGRASIIVSHFFLLRFYYACHQPQA